MEPVALIVQKYGGTSVADPDRMRAVAENVAFTRRHGHDVVVVPSAMGKTTDNLIKLANGTPILRVEAKGMSFSGRKKMFDLQGTHLFDIVKEKFHLHTTFAVEDASGGKIMEVRSSVKCECGFFG